MLPRSCPWICNWARVTGPALTSPPVNNREIINSYYLILVSFWSHFGVILMKFGCDLVYILVSFWCHFVVILSA